LVKIPSKRNIPIKIIKAPLEFGEHDMLQKYFSNCNTFGEEEIAF
jgi:hypothetical protein